MNHEVRHRLAVRAPNRVLADLQLVGPKTRGQCLEPGQRIRPGVVLAQPVRRDVVLVIDEHRAGVGVRRREGHRAAGRQRQRLGTPLAGLGLHAEAQDAALHVLQQRHVKAAARNGDALDARPVVRCVNGLDARQLAALPKRLRVDRQQRSLRESPSRDLPRVAQCEQDSAGVKPGQVDRLRQRQSLEFSVIADEVVRAGVKRQRLVDHRQGCLARIHHSRPDADVLLPPLEHCHGFGKGSAALPAFCNARITGLGQRALAPVCTDEQRVAIEPGYAGLGLRQNKAALDEALGQGVKLAMHRRIGTAPRELDEAAFVAGSEPGDTFVNPVFILSSGQGIDVEYRFPLRLGRAIRHQRRPAQDPPDVLGVPPKIVNVPASYRAVRDAIRGIEQRLGLREEGLVALVGLKLGQSFAVALLHPLECSFALDLLEPKERVVEDRRSPGCIFSQGCACHDQSTKKPGPSFHRRPGTLPSQYAQHNQALGSDFINVRQPASSVQRLTAQFPGSAGRAGFCPSPSIAFTKRPETVALLFTNENILSGCRRENQSRIGSRSLAVRQTHSGYNRRYGRGPRTGGGCLAGRRPR